MSEYRDQALKKIQAEYKSGKYDRYGQVMKADVLRQIEDFIEQDDEFAQAVVQGGTFDAMLNALEVVRQRNPETGEKLKAGAATLLKTLLERVGSET